VSQVISYMPPPAPTELDKRRLILRCIPLLVAIAGLAILYLEGAFVYLNGVHWALIVPALVFTILLPITPKVAVVFARFAVLLVIAAVIMAPFVWLVCSSFKKVVFDDYTFLPPPGAVSVTTNDDGTTKSEPAWNNVGMNNFKTLFTPTETVQGPITFWRYIFNSLFLASVSTFVSLVFCSMGGYAMSKYRFRGRTVLITFMLASMTIPTVVLLAPNFEVIWHLGWMDSYRALIIPGCVSVFGIFLFRQAMLTVPDELLEAGRIDGCGEFKIYLTLVMPLVRPMTSAFCLISFLGAWNAFLGPNIFLQSQTKLTLPVVLNQYLGVYSSQYGVFLAGTLLAIIPPAVLFLALQKEFISGLTSGAVKQ
jgi:ABC-type glycerol-3-phosphate transport system permease component